MDSELNVLNRERSNSAKRREVRKRIVGRVKGIWAEFNTEDWWSVYVGFTCAACAFVVTGCIAAQYAIQTQGFGGDWTSDPSDFFSIFSVSIPMMYVICGVSVWLLQYSLGRQFSIWGYTLTFVLAFFSFWIAAHHKLKSSGVSVAVWAIVLGMFFSNVVFRVVLLLQSCFSSTSERYMDVRRRRREARDRSRESLTMGDRGDLDQERHGLLDQQRDSEEAGLDKRPHIAHLTDGSSSSSEEETTEGYTESEPEGQPIRGDNEYYGDTTDFDSALEDDERESSSAMALEHDLDEDLLAGSPRLGLDLQGSDYVHVNPDASRLGVPPSLHDRALSSREGSVEISVLDLPKASEPEPTPEPVPISKTGLLPEAVKGSPWTRECVPKWVSCLSLDEFYIKVSLVLLIADLASSPMVLGQSIVAGWIDTPIVMIITIVIGKYLFRLGNEHTYPLAASLSVCGASAANAIGSAMGAGKEPVGYAIAVMALFTVPLIPIQPLVFNELLGPSMHLSDDVGGSWIGGSIDTTGAVVASALIISAEAKATAATVKMLQNCIIGPICLVVALTTTNPNADATPKPGMAKRVFRKLRILWDRFPRFVLGFFAVSLFVSFVVPSGEWREGMKALCQFGSTWFETLGFVCIGINIRITELLKNVKAIKLIPLYIIGQSIDLVTTMVSSYVAFGLIKS